MILIEQFIFFYLAFNWVLMLFYKLTALKENESPLRTKIANIKSKIVGDFLYKLIDCRFCLESHLGLIVSCILFYYTQEPMHLIFGYQTVAFNILIEQ